MRDWFFNWMKREPAKASGYVVALAALIVGLLTALGVVSPAVGGALMTFVAGVAKLASNLVRELVMPMVNVNAMRPIYVTELRAPVIPPPPEPPEPSNAA